MEASNNKYTYEVSIVTPLYNASQVITKSIDSVVASCEEANIVWEIIVVNDGSTDNSQQVVEDYIKNSEFKSQIHLISQPNRGVSAARNTGIKAAKHRYIAFNDSDDEWLKDKVKAQLNTLRSNPHIDLLGGIYGDDKVSAIKDIKQLTRITIKDQIFKNYFAAQTCIIKVDALSKSGLFNEDMRYMEDANLFNKIAIVGNAYIQNTTLTKPIAQKHRWGECGLSGNLVEMERGELFNIREVYNDGHISTFTFTLANLFSIAKFIRRLLISRINKFIQR